MRSIVLTSKHFYILSFFFGVLFFSSLICLVLKNQVLTVENKKIRAEHNQLIQASTYMLEKINHLSHKHHQSISEIKQLQKENSFRLSIQRSRELWVKQKNKK